jgi:hypothetical protein
VVEYYPQPAAGQRLTADLLRSMLPVFARRSSDLSRSATTTTSADPALQFEAVANAVYAIDGWIKYDGDNAGDLKLQLSAPSAALGEWTSWGVGNNVVGSTSVPALQLNTQGATGYLIRTETVDINTSRNHGALGAGIGLTLLFQGTVRMSTTPGTVSLDWAQATSSVTATTFFTDSWLRAQRLA